jgi:hypothetical protein
MARWLTVSLRFDWQQKDASLLHNTQTLFGPQRAFWSLNAMALSLELNGRSLTPITDPSLDLRLRIHGDISPILHTSLRRGVYFETGTFSVDYSFVMITVDFPFMICLCVFVHKYWTGVQHIYMTTICVFSVVLLHRPWTKCKYPFHFLISKQLSIFV